MKIEHVAWTVQDPVMLADWYVQYLGLKVIRSFGPPGNARFLADSTGRTLLEVYNNPKVPVPAYASMDPLLLHLAFSVQDVTAERSRLLAAGATAVGEVAFTDTGDELAMLRDPWGFPLQLMRRVTPMP